MDRVEVSLPLLRRWWVFIQERFEPISTLAMIILFFLSHVVLLHFPLWTVFHQIAGKLLMAFLGTVFFFFKLRLYDEIKDYEVDLKINPTRPLPRGLLQHRHLFWMIALLIIGEAGLYYLCGIPAFVSMCFTIGYSLLMYKEFFIPKLIRPHLTTYAMSHTIVTVALGASIFSALLGLYPWQLPGFFWLFVLNNWFMFNIFEFGRKTFASSEERANVESYSSIFGRFGALCLVLLQALLSNYCLWLMGDLAPGVLLFSYSTTVILAIVGLVYVASNSSRMAKVYRIYSSLHIVLFYSGFILLHLIESFK